MSKIYEIICNDGVCSNCQKYSGKFDYIPKNIPPFHQNCKCKIVEIEIEDIIDNLFDKLKEHEGSKNHAYIDTKGNVTIGHGNMFNDVEKFKELPLYFENRLATPEEKETEFYMLRDRKVKKGFLKLPDIEMKILTLKHLKDDLKSVRQKFKDFNNLPKNVQLVILDMEYNMGTNNFSRNKWPNFFEAINKKDWILAGNESSSPDIQLKRNLWRKNMLQSIEE